MGCVSKALATAVPAHTLLGRDLTAEEKDVQCTLIRVLNQYGRVRASNVTVHHVAAGSPELFFAAALSLLDLQLDPLVRQGLLTHLLECPDFLIQLIRPDRFSRERLVEICRRLMKIDPLLDVRLARLTPHRFEGAGPLDPEAVVHLLDVLNEISPGSRLVVKLSHLTHYPDQRIAAKATLLMGRRLRNNDWVERHLNSSDPRVRASVVEALWGTDTFFARKSMWRCLKDKNNRVAGNALMGLYLLGEQRVTGLAKEMLQDPREEFRWTAAWVMGQIATQDFFECLVRARADSSPGVRRAAGRALVALRHLVVAREEKEVKVARAAEPVATEPEVTIEAEKPAPDSEVQPETAEAPPERPIAPAPQEKAKPAPPPNLPTQHRDDPPEDESKDAGLEIQLDGRYIVRR